MRTKYFKMFTFKKKFCSYIVPGQNIKKNTPVNAWVKDKHAHEGTPLLRTVIATDDLVLPYLPTKKT